MSTYSIERAKQLLDTVFYKYAEFYLANTDNLEQITNWMCDKESKIQFSREVARLILEPVVGKEMSSSLCGNISHEQYIHAIAQVDISKYPALLVPENSKNRLQATYYNAFDAEAYKYKDIVFPEEKDICIDGGAEYGDVSLWFMQYNVQKVFAFEPSKFQYPYLCKNIELHNYSERIIPLQLGLANGNRSVSFSEHCEASRISAETENSSIQTIDLDTFCGEQNFCPTYIKFDIEGAELMALEGAKNIIQGRKPKLAICLYHAPKDMIELPMYLKTLVPEYKFYCKANHYCHEFVLYATV